MTRHDLALILLVCVLAGGMVTGLQGLWRRVTGQQRDGA